MLQEQRRTVLLRKFESISDGLGQYAVSDVLVFTDGDLSVVYQ